MKKINDLLNTDNIVPKSPEKPRSSDEIKESAKVVNKIFDVLQAVYPAFKQAWPNEEVFQNAKREWLKALIENEVSSLKQISLGLKKIRSMVNPFVPTVGQFIEWCKPSPESLGVPPLEKAYAQACKNSHPCETRKTWAHDIVYHAWLATGANNLSKLPRSASLPMFERNYDILIKRLLDGCVLDSAPIPLGLEEIKPATKEVALSFLDKMKQQLGV